MLKISLLGKTQFQLATDHSEPFRKSLRLSLLGYLIRTGEPVSRQRLSRIFWPHKQDSQARTYLRNVLARLKTDFSPWLVITKESVFFDVNRDCSVDLLEFEAILKRFEEMGAEEIDSHYETELRTGLELYTGPFLDGFSREVSPWFEEWLATQRREILQVALNGYQKLVFCSILKQRWQVGISDSQRMISLDPNHHESWLLLMRCLVSSGELRRAQAAYEKYERGASADFERTDTGREMNRLYKQIGRRISGINLNFNEGGDSHV